MLFDEAADVPDQIDTSGGERSFAGTYPLLLDAGDELVWGYGRENSAYVVIIDQKGRIAKHWPGYSGGCSGARVLMAEMTGSAREDAYLCGRTYGVA